MDNNREALRIQEYSWSADEDDDTPQQMDGHPRPNNEGNSINTSMGPSMGILTNTFNTIQNSGLMEPPHNMDVTGPPPLSVRGAYSVRNHTLLERNYPIREPISLFDSMPRMTQNRLPQVQSRPQPDPAQRMVQPTTVNRRAHHGPANPPRQGRNSPLREIRSFLALHKAVKSLKSYSINVRPPRGNRALNEERNILHARKRTCNRIFGAPPPASNDLPDLPASAEDPQPSTSTGGMTASRVMIYNKKKPINVDNDDSSDDEDVVIPHKVRIVSPSQHNAAMSNVEAGMSTGVTENSQNILEDIENATDQQEHSTTENAQNEALDDKSIIIRETTPAATPAASHVSDATATNPADDPPPGKELNQWLLNLLECPVCLEWMEPPMAQCRRGHLVCDNCRARLSSCPVCRAIFSSVRNRAMESVAELVRYPCRHGCTRTLRFRRRAGHEDNCVRRRYSCPMPHCELAPQSLPALADHCQLHHNLRTGRKHKFCVKMYVEQHGNWIVSAMHELFHVRINLELRSWCITVYVAYIGPRKNSHKFTYQVAVDGKYNSRKMMYSRITHSDLENYAMTVNRKDCFHLCLEQAMNYLRIRDKQYDTAETMTFVVTLGTAAATAAGAGETHDSSAS